MKFKSDYKKGIISGDDPAIFVRAIRIGKEGPWKMVLGLGEKRIGFHAGTNGKDAESGLNIWVIKDLCKKIEDYQSSSDKGLVYFTNTYIFSSIEERDHALFVIQSALSYFHGAMEGAGDVVVAQTLISDDLQARLDGGAFVRKG